MPYLDGGLVMLRSLIISASTGGIYAQLLLGNCSVQIRYGSLHSKSALVSRPDRASIFAVKTYPGFASQRCWGPCEASVRRNSDNGLPDRDDGNGITCSCLID